MDISSHSNLTSSLKGFGPLKRKQVRTTAKEGAIKTITIIILIAIVINMETPKSKMVSNITSNKTGNTIIMREVLLRRILTRTIIKKR